MPTSPTVPDPRSSKKRARSSSSPAPRMAPAPPQEVRSRHIAQPAIATALDYSSFPHILMAVLTYADHSALLKLRRVSRELRDRVDILLARHLVVSRDRIMPYGEAKWHPRLVHLSPKRMFNGFKYFDPSALTQFVGAHTRILDIETAQNHYFNKFLEATDTKGVCIPTVRDRVEAEYNYRFLAMYFRGVACLIHRPSLKDIPAASGPRHSHFMAGSYAPYQKVVHHIVLNDEFDLASPHPNYFFVETSQRYVLLIKVTQAEIEPGHMGFIQYLKACLDDASWNTLNLTIVNCPSPLFVEVQDILNRPEQFNNVEFLSLDAYREEVGDAQYALETYVGESRRSRVL